MVLYLTPIFYVTIQALIKPNACWESTKMKVFNDFRVRCAVHEKLGWSDTEFNSWLDNHELSAARLFGFRATKKALSTIGAALMSVITIFVYLMLREEIRGITNMIEYR